MLEVNCDGGEVLELPLDLPDGAYFVDLGVDPTVSSVRAYAARSGFGDRCSSKDGHLVFAVPRLDPAENYRALVTPLVGGSPALTDVLFHARRRPIFSSTHALRRALPERHWLVGPSSPDAEDVR